MAETQHHRSDRKSCKKIKVRTGQTKHTWLKTGVLLNLLKSKRGQVNIFQVVFSLQVLPKVVLSRPVLEFLAALVNIAAVKGFDADNHLVDTSLVTVEVVVGAESLGRLGAFCNSAFKGPIVPSSVFAKQMGISVGVSNSPRITRPT